MRESLLLVATTLLASCANLSIPSTGFLADREQLQPSDEYDVRFIPDGLEVYVAPDLNADEYDSILIEPVVYRPVAEPGHELSEDAAAYLERSFGEYLHEYLGRDFEIVEEPGPRTLRLRAAIAEVDPSHVLLNVLTMILLVPVDMGGFSGQVELSDSVTGKRLLAWSGYREGTIFIFFECFFRYGHAWHGMKKWSQLLRSILEDSRMEPTFV